MQVEIRHNKPGNQNPKLQRNEMKGNVTPEYEKQRKPINEEKGLFNQAGWSFCCLLKSILYLGLKMRGIANEKLGILFTVQKTHWKANYPCVNVLSKLVFHCIYLNFQENLCSQVFKENVHLPFSKKAGKKNSYKSIFIFQRKRYNYILFPIKIC